MTPPPFIPQIRRNCDISDAQFAGNFSICGLALRLRDLYKWEHKLEPWVEHPSDQVLAWIGNKEEQWEQLAGESLGALSINGRNIDPFDADRVNSALGASGYQDLFYGAGYANGLKPTFLLAAIEGSTQLDGVRVFLLGREWARDMLTIPALTRGNIIQVRKEAARQYLWDQISYVRPAGRQPLAKALTASGITDQQPAGIQLQLGHLLRLQLPTFIRHELGEIKDSVLPRPTWHEFFAVFARTPVELFARALKDLLADTHDQGPLPHIIRHRRRGALSFYVAFQSSLAARIFPEMAAVYSAQKSGDDWPAIADCVAQGRNTFITLARRLESLYQDGRSRERWDRARQAIQKEVIDPLLAD